MKRLKGQPSVAPSKIKSTTGLNSDFYSVAKVQQRDIEILIWDLGGKPNIRTLWNHYYREAQVILFVIDGTDRSKLPECHRVLWEALQKASKVPVLILVNKRDSEECVSLGAVNEALEVDKISEREVSLMYVSGITM